MTLQLSSLTPKQVVAELDRYIIGQDAAKRAVAIALRNRYRRAQLPKEQADEIIPRNILMIGPTGVGKTEIARRLASLARSPFVKVEATKYTEVGYIGRDVESMVRDLLDHSIRLVKAEKTVEIIEQVEEGVTNRLVDLLAGISKPRQATRRARPLPPSGEFVLADDSGEVEHVPTSHNGENTEDQIGEQHERIRERTKQRLLDGKCEDDEVEVNVEETNSMGIEVLSAHGLEEMGMQLQQMLGDSMPKRRKKRKLPVREAREVLKSQEIDRLLDMDAVVRIAIQRAEEHGIIFVDEIDKIAGVGRSSGPDVSREGVQRDILPLVEGTTVTTKYGPMKTDHVLFIAAGAFHMSKPSDLIPEFQGRFPIRVQLDALTKADFKRILVEPETAIAGQYAALLSTEGISIEYTEDGIDAIADVATQVNDQTENIGARRLSTVLEKVLEEISFEGADLRLAQIIINRDYVMKMVADIAKDTDVSRYIL